MRGVNCAELLLFCEEMLPKQTVEVGGNRLLETDKYQQIRVLFHRVTLKQKVIFD